MNEISAEYKLSLYEEVREISKNKVYIVLSNLSNNVYIKKVLSEECKEIYKILKENENKFRTKIIDCFIYKNQLIVIEEFINGQTLENLVNSKKLSENEAIDIIESVCDGLLDLHERNIEIVHRDIKPENIMINSDGIVKIIDFDASRIISEKKEKDTVILGTPNYASPEQFGFMQTDKRSDIYSIGVLLNYMLVKELPKNKLYGGKIQNIIKKATEIDRENRYKDLQEFKKDLKAFGSEKNNKIYKKKISIKNIVGFRAGLIKNSLFATVWYFTAICLFIGYVSCGQIANSGLGIYLILIPEVILGNFFGLGDYIPFYNSKKKKEGIISRFVIGIIITVFALWIGNLVCT